MTTLQITEARSNFSETLEQVAYQHDRVRIMRRNKVMAVLVSAEDAEFLEAMEDRVDLNEAKAELARMKTKKQRPIPWNKAKTKLGL